MLSLLLTLAIIPGVLPGDYCDSPGERTTWTADQRAQTYRRADAVAVALRVAPIIAAYHDLIIERESRGVASVQHVHGHDSDGTPEHGLGSHGLSLRWHPGKLEGGGQPGWCTPELSTVTAHEIMWRAWHNFGARTVLEIQAVYAGVWDCTGDACIFPLAVSKRKGLCDDLHARGYDCHQPLTKRDLGRRLTAEERRPWALARAREWLAVHGVTSRRAP